MASTVAKRLPKPNWAFIQRRDLYSSIYQALAWSSVGTALAYYYVYVPRYEKLREYDRNYDPFAEMERMRNLGLFSSCPPDYVIEENKQKALAKKK